MSVRPPPSEFLISGNVRVVDLIVSISKQLDRIASMEGLNKQDPNAKTDALHQYARRLRLLAETIEKGK